MENIIIDYDILMAIIIILLCIAASLLMISDMVNTKRIRRLEKKVFDKED